eukprot:460872-Hanusia_phi.AAC.1
MPLSVLGASVKVPGAPSHWTAGPGPGLSPGRALGLGSLTELGSLRLSGLRPMLYSMIHLCQ